MQDSICHARQLIVMKLLILSQYYNPEQFLINEIAPRLVKRGHDVTVLTGLPNYPGGIVLKEYRHGRREEIIDGVKVIRCYEHGRGKTKLDLILNYLSYMISAAIKIRKLGKFDLILCYQLSPITMLFPATIGKKKYGTPILNYCLDIWPESAKAQLGSGFIYRLIAKFSRFLYQKCDCIAVTSEPFIEYLNKENGISREKLIYIPQHADGQMLKQDLSSPENGIADFMFAGNLGKGQKIETIIKATAIIKENNNFLVHIVGDGSMRSVLESMADELGVSDKIIFHGGQLRSNMPEWYKKADALLITLRGNNFVGNTMPGKLQTYMTVGKPILGAINGAAQQVIHEAKCGKCVPAEDATALAEIMLDYIKYPEKYSLCGHNAREYFVNNFTIDVFMARLTKTIQALV